MQAQRLESMLLGHALAAMSHELKNVLAIVGEGAGLMQDILEIAEEQGKSLPEPMTKRLDKALTSIDEQVFRGHRLTSDMNKLAHLPDTRREPQRPMVDLGDTANLAMRLLARRANQGKVLLESTAATDQPVEMDPQLCLAALLALLEWALETAEPGAVITAALLPGAPSLEFYGARFPDQLNTDVKELAEAVGLEITITRTENQRVRVTPTGSRT